mmetsp:Transcript_21694/g.32121  ORF Transcript_21694/g.32121 Transcript_21694/m.32121 type:complete len:94 (-) Transcript_21694:1922-2203(-)
MLHAELLKVLTCTPQQNPAYQTEGSPFILTKDTATNKSSRHKNATSKRNKLFRIEYMLSELGHANLSRRVCTLNQKISEISICPITTMGRYSR